MARCRRSSAIFCASFSWILRSALPSPTGAAWARFVVGGFPEDAARAGAAEEVEPLVAELSRLSPEFKAMWQENRCTQLLVGAVAGWTEARLPQPVSRLQSPRSLDILFTRCISKRCAMQVSKWGNSLAVRLPAAVVEALGLKEGDMLEIQVAGKRAFEVAKAPSARELLARLRKYRGRLPATFKFDRLEANERR
jgi:antitoxin MazE